MYKLPSFAGACTLERAIAIAAFAHEGKRDKAGSPYILHPLRVMEALEGEIPSMVGVLHDVVEDCGIGLGELVEKAGLPAEAARALDLVTRKEGTSYEDFVEGCAFDPVARRVKLADLEDNLRVSRLESLDEKGGERLARYLRSRNRLRLYEQACAGPTSVEFRSHLGELAAVVSLVPRGVEFPVGDVEGWPAGSIRVRYTTELRVQVPPGKFLAIKAALDAEDAEALRAIDPEYAPFLCPECHVPYATRELQVRYEGRTMNRAYATCPEGHRWQVEF